MVTETSGLPRYYRVLHWLRVAKLRKHVNTSRKALKQLARHLPIYEGYHVSLEYAGLKLQEAYQTYYKERKNAPVCRDEHNQSLVDAQVEEGKAGNNSAEQIRARKKREKNEIELGKAARAIHQRDNKHANSRRWRQIRRIANGNRNVSVHRS